MKNTKPLATAPEPEQPIAPGTLRALYPEKLEIELAAANLQIQQRNLQAAAQAFNAKLAKLAEGVNLAEWRMDFKSGRMVRSVPAKEKA